MVCDNTKRNILFGILMIFNVRNSHNVLHYILNGVNFKEIVNVLRNASKPFKSHTRINVGMSKSCVIVVAVVFKLCENKVPELNVSVAFASDLTIGLAAAVFLATVIVNLGARTARTCAVLPEVILLAEAYHMVGLNADNLRPNIVSLVVLFVNAYIKLFGVHFHNLCTEFPRPRNNLFFEVIAEREVTEHFKESAVSCRLADVFNIGCTNTFLTGCNSFSRRGDFAREILFHRCHSRVDKKQALVIVRDKRKAFKSQMSL